MISRRLKSCAVYCAVGGSDLWVYDIWNWKSLVLIYLFWKTTVKLCGCLRIGKECNLTITRSRVIIDLLKVRVNLFLSSQRYKNCSSTASTSTMTIAYVWNVFYFAILVEYNETPHQIHVPAFKPYSDSLWIFKSSLAKAVHCASVIGGRYSGATVKILIFSSPKTTTLLMVVVVVGRQVVCKKLAAARLLKFHYRECVWVLAYFYPNLEVQVT